MRVRSFSGLCLLWMVLLVVASPAAAAQPLKVCATCQYTTIAAALAASNDGDRIIVAPGTYDGGFTITTDVTLLGAGPNATTITDPGGPLVTVVADASVTIRGFSITGAFTGLGSGVGQDGGGVLNHGSLVLANSAVMHNGAGVGGGIYNDGTLTLENDTVAHNLAVGSGGGVFSGLAASLVVIGSAIEDNFAESQGGGIAGGGSITIIDSTVNDNDVSGLNGTGGGISFGSGTLTIIGTQVDYNKSRVFDGGGGITTHGTTSITDSEINGNSACAGVTDPRSPGGGGILIGDGSVTITNSTVDGNSTCNSGAGIYNNFAGSLTLRDSTVSNNVADNFGGGIYNNGSVTLLGTDLFFNNVPDDCVGVSGC